MEQELTNDQIERLDFIHNKIYRLVREVTPMEHRRKIEWDMEVIGEVSDVIEDYLVSKKICTAMEFAPYVERE